MDTVESTVTASAADFTISDSRRGAISNITVVGPY
jgi:hypothetical protein